MAVLGDAGLRLYGLYGMSACSDLGWPCCSLLGYIRGFYRILGLSGCVLDYCYDF